MKLDSPAFCPVNKLLYILLSVALCSNLAAFELQGIGAAQVPGGDASLPERSVPAVVWGYKAVSAPPQAGRPVDGGAAVAYTSAHAARLSSIAGAGPVLYLKVSGGMDRQDLYFYNGVPTNVARVRPAAVGLKRHWTSNAQADGVAVVDLIVRSGLLKAGQRPYIRPESHRADYYPDLHGVFFTTPDFPSPELLMGLEPDSDYVDFVVNPAMGALSLAPGNYMFPCPLNLKPWIKDAYAAWKSGGPMPPGMEATFKQITLEGGLHNPIDVPITVVRYQVKGKVTVLRPDLLKKPY